MEDLEKEVDRELDKLFLSFHRWITKVEKKYNVSIFSTLNIHVSDSEGECFTGRWDTNAPDREIFDIMNEDIINSFVEEDDNE